MPTPEQRLAELGLAVPEVAKPVAAYVPAVRTGNYVYTSGQLPMRDGTLITTGKVGGEVTSSRPSSVPSSARSTASLPSGRSSATSSRVVRVVKVVGFVASTPDFTGQPGVVNGASELIGKVFGDAGQHARSAVGVSGAPARRARRGRAGRRGLLTLSRRRQVPPELVADYARFLSGEQTAGRGAGCLDRDAAARPAAEPSSAASQTASRST